MIELEGLTKKFGETTAVENVTLSVAEGEVFGLLGPNGAGKTTTVRMLCCLISKTSGRALIGSYEVGRSKEDVMGIRRTIGVLPESVGFYDDLSAYKNLDYYGRLYERSEEQRRERIEYFLRSLGLWQEKDAPMGTFSKGMKQKVAIARALVHDPQVIFLDEPTANLDPESSRAIRGFIIDLGRRERKTVFVNTHNLDEAERICGRIGVMKKRLLAVGRPEELRRSLGGRRTSIKVEKLDDRIIAAARSATGARRVIVGRGEEGEEKGGEGGGGNETERDTLVVDVTDPDKENPGIVEAIVRAGGRVRYVTEFGQTLEDAYLKLVGDESM